MACFYYVFLTPISLDEDSPEETAFTVVFWCVIQALLITSIIYFLDFPKDLLGIHHTADFWPLMKVFGVGAGVWTLLGWILFPVYHKDIIVAAHDARRKRELDQIAEESRQRNEIARKEYGIQPTRMSESEEERLKESRREFYAKLRKERGE